MKIEKIVKWTDKDTGAQCSFAHCEDGKVRYHSEDGPAYIGEDGTVTWMYFDKRMTFRGWCRKAKVSLEDQTLLKLQYG